MPNGQKFLETNSITNVNCEAGKLIAFLNDGREISAPLKWYPRLENATSQQKKNWKLVGQGYGIHWPDIDEDISLEMLLRGQPSIEAHIPR